MHKYNKKDCIIWLKNPQYDPITFEILDKTKFYKLSLLSIKLLDIEQIYIINKDMFYILELDKYYDVL
jgi:hypothetical protein